MENLLLKILRISEEPCAIQMILSTDSVNKVPGWLTGRFQAPTQISSDVGKDDFKFS